MDASGTLYLRNIEQVALFELELKGQISDGQWENARPGNHWQAWCRAEVKVGDPVGRDFDVRRDRYGLTSSELLDVIGGRMLGQVRLVRAFGLEATAKDLEVFVECNAGFKVGICLKAMLGDGYYADKWAALGDEYKLDDILRAINDEAYGRRELIKDLRDIGRSMKIRLMRP